jgi:hypothetical protein
VKSSNLYSYSSFVPYDLWCYETKLMNSISASVIGVERKLLPDGSAYELRRAKAATVPAMATVASVFLNMIF